MRNPERAAQFWSVLVMAARNQQILTYKVMEKLTGIPQWGQAEILGLVGAYCEKKHYPKLTSIVVSEESGLPMPKMGITDPVGLLTEHTKVFVFPWFDKETPSTKDFEGNA